ncbi:hypothetical protein [uncultured Tenacibaculum sp.]|uniref:hypothetical protein n=1 Tax=uncultured Tenacibaculum sp. TaxID=174713 RepID=UPI00262ADE73|nr:hypothetical protein [uncultured Tenacibaculum sp.]
MSFIIFLSFIKSLLFDVVLYFLGKILSNPDELREFLGLTDRKKEYYETTSKYVEKIGKLLIYIAIAGFIITVSSNIKLLAFI